ncbi:MAG: Gfo/Idh/MocA family oxidoreductase, partial [Planctomycetaceae bacterium]|nr:Gfo/Idh/MocA family oxidoreductase [Planctomycetaceae bacterium]
MYYENLFPRRRFLKIAGTIAAGTVIANETVTAENTTAENAVVPPRIKIGQLGVGHMHAYKMGDLRKLNEIFEVVGVAEDDPKLRASAEKQAVYQGLKWMSSEELLAVPELQAVSVETEEHLLIPAALRCIRAGKHIHLDKPAGES